MRLPLIVNWDARINKRGPSVLLGSGKWRLSGDYKPMVYLCQREPDLRTTVNTNPSFEFDGPTEVWIEFPESCRENPVTIYAERL